MSGLGFVDYYELLQVSPNADSETIERIFRHLAKKYYSVADILGGLSGKAFIRQVVHSGGGEQSINEGRNGAAFQILNIGCED